MAEQLGVYLNSLTEEVLKAPGYVDLPEEEKQNVRAKLEEHFQNMITETALNRMTEEQVKEIEEAMGDSPEQAEAKMEEITATIPGLALDIEERLDQEVANLKKLGQAQPESEAGSE